MRITSELQHIPFLDIFTCNTGEDLANGWTFQYLKIPQCTGYILRMIIAQEREYYKFMSRRLITECGKWGFVVNTTEKSTCALEENIELGIGKWRNNLPKRGI